MEEQQATFKRLWDRFSRQVSNNDGFVDYPDQTGLRSQYVTTVVRLPQDIAQKCFSSLALELPNDYHYPMSDMHLTLLNLDALLANHALDNEQKMVLVEKIEKSISTLPPLEFKVSGLGLFPTTIYAQIYDVNEALEIYRKAIKDAVNELTGGESDGQALVKGIAFANLVRFKQKPGPKLVGIINNLREVEFGSFTAARFELVTTDKLLSQENTRIHKPIPLPIK